MQAAFGRIAEPAIVAIAAALNLSRAVVSGVVGFYHDFRRAPAPLPVIKLCQAEGCQARGSEPLAAWAERTAAGRVAIEPVYCLGLCAVGPSAMVGTEVYARLDERALGADRGGAVRVFVPDDAVAKACGAERIARKLADRGYEVVRTSSWGMHWLEPLVEIETETGCIGYGPVTPGNVDALLAGALADWRCCLLPLHRCARICARR